MNMKQKIMDIQKSLFIGWFPKTAHNVRVLPMVAQLKN